VVDTEDGDFGAIVFFPGELWDPEMELDLSGLHWPKAFPF
jgi:hypothetical protein